MTVWGVVASAGVWTVVGNDWDKDAYPLGWVSFSPEEAQVLIASGGITHVLVEARADVLHESLVAAVDVAGVTLVALVTGTAAEQVASSQGISYRVRQPADLHEFIDPPTPPHHITEAEPQGNGLTIAVWGPTGAPGRTTIATTLASLFASQGLRTLLIDADSRSGAIAPALGLLDEVPGFIASCRLADRGQLASSDLRRLAHRYDQGHTAVDVLTGVTSGRHYPEVTPETVKEVVELAQAEWEVVVIDTGSDIAAEDKTPSTTEQVATTCLQLCDEAVAVCQATPVGVARFARVFDHARKRRGTKPFPVVLNGIDVSRRTIGDEATLREALRRFAEVSVVQVIARDASACRQAEMAGLSVADCVPKSALVAGVKALAARWLEDAVARRHRADRELSEPAARPDPPKRRIAQRRSEPWWRILSKRMFALR